MATTLEKTTVEKIVKSYMQYVLENEKPPVSVYKFCKESKFKEADFYRYFGSFQALQKHIWVLFYENSASVISTAEGFESLSSKDKLLTFYYTFFEVLAANRSYILQVLENNSKEFKHLMQLSGLRKNVVVFAEELVMNDNAEKTLKITKRSEKIFAEAAWVQTLFILKFWLNDSSPAFEKTDLVIEKSVRVVFDVFDSTPLESLLDFGKFLWKEATV